MSFADDLAAARVLPVVTAQDVDSTVALTQALLKGGMRAVEITLRTDAALDSIREVKAAVPDVQVAAGTITNPREMEQAMAAGADFCVSPGISEALLHCAGENNVNFLPGVATASEVMLGLDFGVGMFKLFPAEAVGGIPLIKSLGGPFPAARFGWLDPGELPSVPGPAQCNLLRRFLDGVGQVGEG